MGLDPDQQNVFLSLPQRNLDWVLWGGGGGKINLEKIKKQYALIQGWQKKQKTLKWGRLPEV
jgi:hypothetical protein